MAEQEEYSYIAVNASGKKIRGIVRSTSRGKAYHEVLGKGLQPLEVNKKEESLLSKDFQIPGFEKKAKLKNLVVFTKQFALMYRSGMRLPEAVETAKESTEDDVLRVALREVYADIDRGVSFSDALEKHPTAFPGLLTSVVRVGEDSGKLAAAMEAMARTYQTELEMKQRVKSAMTYPTIVVVLIVAVMTGMMLFAVPLFKDMFENLDAELPLPTQILVAISAKAVIILPVLAALTLTGFIVFKKNRQELWLKKPLDLVMLEAPVFGTLNRGNIIARFSRNLAMMLRAGVLLSPALKLVSATTENYHIEEATARAVRRMANGDSIKDAIQEYDMFPRMVRNMIAVGEKSGDLSSMLDSIADFYELEVKTLSEKLAESLQPYVLIILGGLVGGMLWALYSPMFNLFVKMSEG